MASQDDGIESDKPISSDLVQTSDAMKWDLIREDYIAQNLRRKKGDPAFTLKQAAEVHQVSYIYLRQIAASQKWTILLRERAEKIRKEALNELRDVTLFDELAIRTRAATFARLASSLAYEKLISLKKKDIEKMSIKEAIELLKVGLAEERQALGLSDMGPLSPEGAMFDRKGLTEMEVFAVARRVLDMKQGAVRQASDDEPDDESD